MRKNVTSYWTGALSLAAALVGTALPLNFANAQDNTTTTTSPPPVTTPATKPPSLSYGAAEVVKMYQGGIGKDVLIHYIDSNALLFHLDADGIIYLKNMNLPQDVISALIRRDGELQKEAAAAYQQQQQMQAAQQPPPGAYAGANTGAYPPQMAMPSSPAPQVAPYPPVDNSTVVYPDYGVSAYPYYPYYYGYPYYWGGGLGWGWGRGGWGWGGHGGWSGGGRAGFGGHVGGGFGGHGGGGFGGHR